MHLYGGVCKIWLKWRPSSTHLRARTNECICHLLLEPWPTPCPLLQAGLIPLAAHKESPSSFSAYVLEAWSNPNILVDEEGNTLLHVCESPRVMAFLLGHPLIEVNVTNKVRLNVERQGAVFVLILSTSHPDAHQNIWTNEHLMTDAYRTQTGLTALMAAVVNSVGDAGIPTKVR